MIPNQHYIERYNKFITYCKSRKIQSDTYTETHHIIPKSLGGDDSSDNKIILTGREHYIAHWILSYAYGGSMDYAFWMMNHVTHYKNYKRYINSRGYEIARKRSIKGMSKMLSEKNKGTMIAYDAVTNTNRKVTVEDYKNNKDRYSSLFKGKAVFVLDGNKVMLSVDDPLVKSGEAVHYRVGYKHKQTTIQKMIENSGLVGKRMITDGKNITYISDDEDLPDGWQYGMTKEQKEKCSVLRKETFKVCKWITDGVNNKRIKIHSDDDIPSGWRIGRTLQKVVCEWCGKEMDKPNYTQSHGELCKARPVTEEDKQSEWYKRRLETQKKRSELAKKSWLKKEY